MSCIIFWEFFENRENEKKQGDKIEHIDFVKKRGLKPDVEFYITNQIQNPVAQLFALGIEQLDGYVPRKYNENPDLDEEEGTLFVLKQKEKDLDGILFMGASYLKKHKRGPMQMKVQNMANLFFLRLFQDRQM